MKNVEEKMVLTEADKMVAYVPYVVLSKGKNIIVMKKADGTYVKAKACDKATGNNVKYVGCTPMTKAHKMRKATTRDFMVYLQAK